MTFDEAFDAFESLSRLLHEARALREQERHGTADARLRQVEKAWPWIERDLRRALWQGLSPRSVAEAVLALEREMEDFCPPPPGDLPGGSE